MEELELKINTWLFRIDKSGRRRLWMKLSKLLSNGVAIIEALNSIHQRQVQSGRGKSPLSMALASWMLQLKNGKRFSEAIEGWVEKDEQMILAAGEQSGDLFESMTSASEVMAAKKRIQKAVFSGIAYPVVTLGMGFAVLYLFSFQIIPNFSRVVSPDKWQGTARYLVDFANFSRDWVLIIAIAIVGLITAFLISLPRWSGGLRIKLDKFPPYSIYRMLQGSTWLISFATLVAAGVRVENALDKLSYGAHPWLKVRINACLRGMKSGMNPGEALSKSGYGFPDEEIIDDLTVYARLSGFDQALEILGREWIAESVESIDSMMKVVFGVSIFIVGLFIAFMVGGLIDMELQMSTIMQSAYR